MGMDIDLNNIDPDDPLMADAAKLVAENAALHVKHEVILMGGAADGQKMEIPDGVHNLNVEVNGQDYTYLRSAKRKYQFQVHA